MRTRNLVLLVTLVALICALFSAAHGSTEQKAASLKGRVHSLDLSKSVPAQLNYQGFLVDAADSSAVTTTLEMTFRLFDSESNGTEQWSETHPTVEVTGGLFQILLGSVTTFPENLFDGSPLWLQTEVGTEVLTPRKPLVSVAYSHRADDADKLEGQTLTDLDDRWVNEDQAASVTSSMITDEEITDADISATAAIHPAKISGTAWTSDNDGAGSGLDADLVDGQQASEFLSTASDYGRSGVGDSLFEGTTTLTDKYLGITAKAADADQLDGMDSAAFSDTAHQHDDRYYTENELNTPGTINDSSNPVDWTKLKSVPATFADGYDDVGDSGGVSQILEGDGIEVTNPTGPTTEIAAEFGTGSTQVARGNHHHDADYVNEGQASSITSGMIVNSAVTSAKIQDGAVGNADLAPDAVTSTKILDGTIQQADLGFTPGGDDDWTIAEPNIYRETGNVGIGTTSPASKLDVSGAVNTDSLYEIGGNAVLSAAGSQNIFVGIEAGAHNTGGWVTCVGYNAGYNNQGNDNVFVGRRAGYANTTGGSNTYLGQSAGFYNTEGYENTFLGSAAGYQNTTGYANTCLGRHAGYSNVTGTGNVFVGYKAGYHETGSDNLYIANGPDASDVLIYGDFSTGNLGIGTTTPSAKLDVGGDVNADSVYKIGGNAVLSAAGTENILVGIAAGGNNTGSYVTFVGDSAGYYNQVNYNTFIGWNAGHSNTAGTNNTFVGNWAGRSNTDGLDNTFLGSRAGSDNTIGELNTFVGNSAGADNTWGYANTFVGNNAGRFQTDSHHNSFFGTYAGRDNTGNHNTFIGSSAGSWNETGSYNTFVGLSAGVQNTTGEENTFLGAHAGLGNSTGRYNTYVGYETGYSVSSAFYNTFLGHQAGYSNSGGGSNTFLGTSAGYANTTGAGNTYVGTSAGYHNQEGHYNVIVGCTAGLSKGSGDRNIFIGYHAGYGNSTGDNNTFLGTGTGYNNINGEGNVFIGHDAGHDERGSNKLYIANGADTSDVLIYGDFSTNRIGIGTLDPKAQLHLSSTLYVGEASGSNPQISLSDEGDYGRIQSWNGDLFINPLGNEVGIWTTNATHSLTVDGSIALQQDDVTKYHFDYYGGGLNIAETSVADYRLFIKDGGNVGIGVSNPTYRLQLPDNANESGRGRANQWTTYSSREEKRDITTLGPEDYAAVLEEIAEMDLVYYRYKNQEDERLYLGVIAEDAPKQVVTSDRKGLSLSEFTAFAMAGLKAQQEQIEELEEEIRMLRAQLEDRR